MCAEYKTACVVGGLGYEEQAAKLRRGVEMLVATPGRLVDCLQRRYAVLNQCNYIVLDEADRMIDLGFEPSVTQIMEAMPSSNLKPEDEDILLEADRKYRTTYMFSATMPLEVRVSFPLSLDWMTILHSYVELWLSHYPNDVPWLSHNCTIVDSKLTARHARFPRPTDAPRDAHALLSARALRSQLSGDRTRILCSEVEIRCCAIAENIFVVLHDVHVLRDHASGIAP